MCPSCKSEYENPQDRRFQSELNCCPQCGPNYYLLDDGTRYEGETMFQRAASRLNAGKIILVKNNGGYHLSMRCIE